MDDVISLWNYGKAELRGFLDRLNTYDRNLQFTLEVEIDHFNSNHLLQVKRAVVTSLIDRALNICSVSYINAEINFIRDILFGNGYPIPFVNKIINGRIKRLSFKIEEDTSQCEAIDKPSNIV